MSYPYKRIADPVHGTVSITEFESKIIQTKSFQRLRNVKQLGLAYLVYPGADYSRFSHSLGACHVAGQILDSLEKGDRLKQLGSIKEKDHTIKLLRVAALLHDVGHYPFSHTMEHAIKEHYKGTWLKRVAPGTKEGGEALVAEGAHEQTYITEEELQKKSPLDHEKVGKRLMEFDPEISGLLEEEGIGVKQLSAIFRKEEGTETKLSNLISADLDVDRLDYLQRTAHHTSLPYGNVDIRYLLSQVRLDNENRLALSHKAMRTAEHLLLGRYFDYMQVSYHKTVAAIELLLADVIKCMLKSGGIKCSEYDVKKMIETGSWTDFDDGFMWGRFRSFMENASGVNKEKANWLLNRKIPKMLVEFERVDEREYETEFEKLVQRVKAQIPTWAHESGIDSEYWYVWNQKRSLTNTAHGDKDDPEKAAKSVRILDTRSTASYPIIEYEPSLMRLLGKYQLYALRVYVMNDQVRQDENYRRQVAELIEKEFSDINWR